MKKNQSNGQLVATKTYVTPSQAKSKVPKQCRSQDERSWSSWTSSESCKKSRLSTIPIGTNWSNTNKGDVDKVVSRLRLVATEFEVHQVKMGILRDDVFSATPFFWKHCNSC